MFVISTRNFPPEIGGMQSLMGGLAISLQKYGPVKVFAEEIKNSSDFDKKINLDIFRVGGFKIFRKFRKASLVKEFSKKNNVRAFFFDHWKSIENLDLQILKNTPSFCLIHSKEINHEKGSFVNRRMIKSLDKSTYIVANSEFTKSLAIKNGVSEEKIKIINPGCNYPINIDNKNQETARELFRNCFPKII